MHSIILEGCVPWLAYRRTGLRYYTPTKPIPFVCNYLLLRMWHLAFDYGNIISYTKKYIINRHTPSDKAYKASHNEEWNSAYCALAPHVGWTGAGGVTSDNSSNGFLRSNTTRSFFFCKSAKIVSDCIAILFYFSFGQVNLAIARLTCWNRWVNFQS